MKEYFINGTWLKDIRFWAVVIILALLIWYFKSCNNKAEPIKMDFNKTEYIDSHAKLPVVEVTKEQMKHIRDSIARTIKGEVRYITQTVIKVDTVFVDQVVRIDSTKKTFFTEKKDNYLTLSVEGNWETKKAKVGLTLVDTLTHVVTKERKFLKSNELNIYIQHKNPYMTSVSGRSFTLKERKTLLSFGLVGAYGISNKGLVPFVGLGVTLPIINIYTK